MKAKPAFVGARQRAPGTQYGWKPAKHRPRRPAPPPPPPDPLAFHRKLVEAANLADVAAMLHERDTAVVQQTFEKTIEMLRNTNLLNTQRLVRTILEHDDDGEVIGSHQEFIP